MPAIHYYDTDTGYIHYASEVIPGLECRVLDAIRTVEDAALDPITAVQFIPHSCRHGTPADIHDNFQQLFNEAVTISNMGTAFMDTLMATSIFRNNEAWLNGPNGRFMFMSQRETRLKAWRSQGLHQARRSKSPRNNKGKRR